MSERSTDEVPGMAEAIEARRKQLGLRPGEFADRAGLTPTGLAPVRKGYEREYNEKTLHGVATALNWVLDWYELLKDGVDWRDLDRSDIVHLKDGQVHVVELKTLKHADTREKKLAGVLDTLLHSPDRTLDRVVTYLFVLAKGDAEASLDERIVMHQELLGATAEDARMICTTPPWSDDHVATLRKYGWHRVDGALEPLPDKYALAADTGDELDEIDPTEGSTTKPR